MDAKQLAEQYLDAADYFRNIVLSSTPAPLEDCEAAKKNKDDLYRQMLDITRKTDGEYPAGRKLALDILDGKVRYEENV